MIRDGETTALALMENLGEDNSSAGMGRLVGTQDGPENSDVAMAEAAAQ